MKLAERNRQDKKNVWMNVACTVSSSFASCQSDVRQINQSSE
jgi:hypothetical protein